MKNLTVLLIFLILCTAVAEANNRAYYFDFLSGKKLEFDSRSHEESLPELNFYDKIRFTYPEFYDVGNSGVTEKINEFLSGRVNNFVKTKEFRLMLHDHLKQAGRYLVGEESNYRFGYNAEWRDLLEPDLEDVGYEILNYTHPMLTLRIHYQYQPYLERSKVGYGMAFSQTWYIDVRNGEVSSPGDVFKPESMPALKTLFIDQINYWLTQLPPSITRYSELDAYLDKMPEPGKEKLLKEYEPDLGGGEFAFIMGDKLFYYIPPFTQSLRNESAFILYTDISEVAHLLSPGGPLGFTKYLTFTSPDSIPAAEPLTRSLPNFEHKPIYNTNVLPPRDMTAGVRKLIVMHRSISPGGEPGPPDTISQIHLNRENEVEKIIRKQEEVNFRFADGKVVKEITSARNKLVQVRDYQYKDDRLESSLTVSYGRPSGELSSLRLEVYSYFNNGRLSVSFSPGSPEVYSQAGFSEFFGPKQSTHNFYYSNQTRGSIRHFNEQGRLLASYGDVLGPAAGIFYYYENGLLKYVENDTWRHLRTFTYNEASLPVKETHYDSYSKQSEWLYDYDENGRFFRITHNRNIWEIGYEML